MPRQLERYSISLQIVLEWSSGKREARISDISMGGCFVDSIANVRAGDLVNFALSLPTGQWEQLYGEVAYVLQGFGFGVRFTELSPQQQSLLEQIIIASGGQPWATADIPRSTPETAPPPVSEEVRRVLLVGRDLESRMVIKRILEDEKFEVVAADDVQAAYSSLLSNSNFIAAIFDVMTVDSQELNLIRFMRTEKRLEQIAVGVVTANPDPTLWSKSVVAGASMFLPKPFNPNQIRYMLNVLAHQHQHQR